MERARVNQRPYDLTYLERRRKYNQLFPFSINPLSCLEEYQGGIDFIMSEARLLFQRELRRLIYLEFRNASQGRETKKADLEGETIE